MENLYKKIQFFLEKRIFLHVQTYNLYVKKKIWRKRWTENHKGNSKNGKTWTLPMILSFPESCGTKNFTATEQLRDLDLDLQLFYDYVRGRPAQTDFTKELDATIFRMKQEKEERNMYLTYTTRMMEFRRDGLEEGISIGLQAGLQQGIERGAYENKLGTAKMLLSYGDSPEKVAICTNLPLDVVLELAHHPLQEVREDGTSVQLV